MALWNHPICRLFPTCFSTFYMKFAMNFPLWSSVAAPAPALITTFQLVQKIKRGRKAYLLAFKTPFGNHTFLLLTSLWLDLCHGSKESGRCSLYFRWLCVQLKVRGCIIKEEGEYRKWGSLALCGTITVLQADCVCCGDSYIGVDL